MKGSRFLTFHTTNQMIKRVVVLFLVLQMLIFLQKKICRERENIDERYDKYKEETS